MLYFNSTNGYSYYIVYLFKVAFPPDYSLFVLYKCDFDGFIYVRCFGRENKVKYFGINLILGLYGN